jgi:hypothetical protein
MKNVKTESAESGKKVSRRELISVLSEISDVTQRLAERLAFAEWRQANTKEAAK